jgi:hypothetical protein
MTRRDLISLLWLPRPQRSVGTGTDVCAGCEGSKWVPLGALVTGSLESDLTSRVIVQRELQLERCTTCGTLRAVTGPHI